MTVKYFAAAFSGALAPVGVPAVSGSVGNFAEPGIFDVKICHFGLPNDERYFPTRFATLPSDAFPVWEMIDNGAHPREVLVAILVRCGYLGKAAWRIAENDRYAFQFYRDVLHWRGRVCDYQKQQISYTELLGSVLLFCLKNLYRACRGSIISKEVLSLSNLDKLAASGQGNSKSAIETYQESIEQSDVLANVNASGIDPTVQKASHNNTKAVLSECLTQPAPQCLIAANGQGNPKSAIEAYQESIEWTDAPAEVIVKNDAPIATRDNGVASDMLWALQVSKLPDDKIRHWVMSKSGLGHVDIAKSEHPTWEQDYGREQAKEMWASEGEKIRMHVRSVESMLAKQKQS